MLLKAGQNKNAGNEKGVLSCLIFLTSCCIRDKMIIMNNSVFAAFLVLFCLSKDCESCFSTNYYESLKISRGSPFYKECRCTEPGTGTLRWLDKNNRVVPTLRSGTKSNVYTEWRDENTYSIFISNISESVSGIYKCVTLYDGKEYSLAYNIQAYDPLYFVQTKENQYLVSGEDSPITCEARGGSNLIISWHKEQSLIEPGDEKYEITPNGLTIRNVSSEDKGFYKCTALDPETGEGIDTDIKVEVMYLPVIEEVVATPKKTVISGESLTIECKANGVPHPDYSWRKVSNITSGENNVTWNEITNKLIFDSIDPDDRGTYECTASNLAGNVTKEINIEVLIAPIITEFDNVTATEGSTIQIACKAFGRPRPNVTVSFLGEPFRDSILWDIKKSELETELYLTFYKIDRVHSGTYMCNASNEVETIYQDMTLTVLHKPYFKTKSEIVWGWNGHTVNLSCENESNPPATINWKYQGNDIPTLEQVAVNDLLVENLTIMPLEFNKETMFGVYECTAANEIGEDKKFITIQAAYPPPPVENVTIADITSTSVTFNISEPVNVWGPPVIGFTSEYDESVNYNVTNIHINRTWSKNRPLKIDKLKPNTTYYIKFAAVNNVGAGSWSDILDFVTLERSAPEQLIWESDSETAATDRVLKWKAPDDNGEPIDYYAVRYCTINQDTMEEIECKEERIIPTTKFQLNQMDANTTYYFEILAHNSMGNSSVSNIYVTIPVSAAEELSYVSAGGFIGIALVVVLMCLVIVDVILLVWRRQGIIASCCLKKNKKRIEDTMQSRDKKGLLKDNGESVASDTLKRPDKEYEYKHTGIITGKHSAV